ncbi:Carboxypeptidase B [Nymphon striatum]|nr:Carboxypeptidase B [Nymphon striatum]
MEHGRHELSAMIPPHNSEELINYFTSEGLKFAIDIDDVDNLIKSQFAGRVKRDAPSRNLSATNVYNNFENIVSMLEEWDRQYSHLEVMTLGTTEHNRTIFGVKISSNQSSGKPAIMLEFGTHAREWISTASGLSFINKLATGYGKDSDVTSIVNKFDWYIIPVTNPDGYVYTWKSDRLWRKNRATKHLRKCIGVDINRNFDAHFDNCYGESECSEIYCGSSAFSEPESDAIRKLAISLQNRLKAYFSIHSYSQLVSYPHGYSSSPVKNQSKYAKWAKNLAQEMSKPYGTIYSSCNIATGVYTVSGDSVDWVFDTLGVEASFAIELRDDGAFGFLLPEDQIEPTANELFHGVTTFVQQL